MRCSNCDGTGKVVHPMMSMNGDEYTGEWEQHECEVCGGTGEMEMEMTNEEWFDTLSTEEKAKVLRRKTYGNSEDNESVEQGWVNWLKEKHEDNPPDIPSVPSWDKWLEGERTKCEYCDGNSTECELVGRSECPRTPKTEQEYIQTCNHKELTEILFRMIVHGSVIRPDRQYISEWLKQQHTTE